MALSVAFFRLVRTLAFGLAAGALLTYRASHAVSAGPGDSTPLFSSGCGHAQPKPHDYSHKHANAGTLARRVTDTVTTSFADPLTHSHPGQRLRHDRRELGRTEHRDQCHRRAVPAQSDDDPFLGPAQQGRRFRDG